MNRLYYSDIRLLEGNCCSELRLTIPTANPNTCIFLMLFWDSKSPNIPIKEIENNSTRVKNLVQGSSASSSRPWLRISTPSFFDPSLAKGGRVGQLTQLRWSLKQTLGEFPLHWVYGRKNTRTREISQRLSCSCQLGHSCNLSGYKDHEKYIPSLSLVIGAKEFLSHIVVFGFATLYCKFQSTIVFAHITMVVRGSLRVVLTAVWSSDDQCPEQSLGHIYWNTFRFLYKTGVFRIFSALHVFHLIMYLVVNQIVNHLGGKKPSQIRNFSLGSPHFHWFLSHFFKYFTYPQSYRKNKRV